ncbi:MULTISPECIES: hypothetical protein [unclassified Rhizobium]|uniref:hypothetical protein n=1 Tax=unclassified Rhizobium TaxID=2613769 RepID=UPI0006F5A43B|nr:MULTISPECIES: hypothetical protein [unclassified Rhizobium]KQV34625.1 hypothetical protein ASC86_13930 [Rhizobium sp. Root1212]KRD23959.1 hypothetical protein ASE37_13925 [Rhizobium sp. Root268]
MANAIHQDIPITPSELDMLHGLFHSICRAKSIESQSEEGSSMAVQLLARFNDGARNEEELLLAMGD